MEDLHELTLAEAGQLRLERLPVNVADLVRASVAQFTRVAEAEGVRFTLAVADDLPEVEGDADRLAQVLSNLLGNAVRHTPAGGQIAVRAGRVSEGVRIEVADSGTGIAPEDLPHVFDRFYRGDKSRSRRDGGAGLGLAIVRQLVTAHGGRIEVSSAVGQGTTFTVWLPVGHPVAGLTV